MELPKSRADRIRWGVIGALVVAGGWLLSHQFESLDLEELLVDVSETLGDWTYLLAGVLAFLETGAFVGLVVPGETFVILAGAVAGVDVTNLYVTIAIVWFSAWAGDSTSFMIGRRLGRGFILRHGPKLRITTERFGQVERYFERHGGKTILVGRFIGLVRALAPFIAGSSGMAYRAFLPYSVLGTGLWAGTFCVLGFFGARSLEEIADQAGRGIFVFGATVALVVGIVVAVRFLREQRNRTRAVEWMDARAPLRPLVALGRRVKPQARFLWNRITPGGLGLELTALLAVMAVSVFVLVGFASIVSNDPLPTHGDTTAFDFVAELNAAWLTDVAEVVTTLGSGLVTLLVALAAAIVLAASRRWPELAVLVGAVVIAHVAVPELKEAIDRPRPGGALVEADGSGYPSGHAAFSVLYAWLGMTAALRLRPGWAGGTAVIVVGVALTVAVGLSRVYLNVHWLSDVSGGWALGVSAFALCAIVALVVTHLRQNPPAVRRTTRQ